MNDGGKEARQVYIVLRKKRKEWRKEGKRAGEWNVEKREEKRRHSLKGGRNENQKEREMCRMRERCRQVR